MKKMKVFIDGQDGTTGLQLEERLNNRDDIELLFIEPEKSWDEDSKIVLMDQADVIFLCLPDDAARRSAEIAPLDAVVIDASTAHRTKPGWVYGFPELSTGHRSAIEKGKRIAMPGCHACGFISMIYPLVTKGLLSKDAQVNCTSLTGYSGGGRALIETYECKKRLDSTNQFDDPLRAPRPYALGLTHKHLPEMQMQTGLDHPPHFYPVVGDMSRGMLVSVHLWASQFTKPVTPGHIEEILTEHYTGNYAESHFDGRAGNNTDGHFDGRNGVGFVKIMGPAPQGFLDPTMCNGTNRLELFVSGHEDQILITARLDNLGKGASGAAVQCMNIACGLDERMGL